MFEQSDVIGAYWHPYIQLRQKLVDPPGEVKPETEIYRLLAERLGIRLPEGSLPGSSDADVDAWLAQRLAPFPELSLERLRAGPVTAPGHEEVAFADQVFPTPSGKIELASEEATRRWGVDTLPDYQESEESSRNASEPARFPLYLMTPNTKNRIHSQFGNLRMIRGVSERPLVRVAPRDARARGVTDGARVRVFNDRGSFEVEAKIDGGMRRGCVSVTNGFWASEGGAANVCSRGRETDMGHGAAFHDNRVEVELAG
jgi:anaerobic selenocysteine-containing dehydrogenase